MAASTLSPVPLSASTTAIFAADILKGKVALVTGGGSGICKGIAGAFMRHGANVVIFGRTASKLEEAARELTGATGQVCKTVAGDVRKPEDCDKAVKAVLENFGRLDVLINGAAGNFLALLETMSPRAFRTVIEIDLLGTFNMTRACKDALFASKGSVMQLSATLHYTGTPLQGHAGTAKAGIDAFTRHLAVEWGPKGVRVNCIAPGPIGETEGISKLMPPQYAERAVAMIPCGRMGQIRDVEHMALFLASDGAIWINGQVFVVDGGAWLLGSGIGVQMYPQSVVAGAKL